MADVNDRCVALVVTSPMYYAGKEYEQAPPSPTRNAGVALGAAG